MDSAVSNSPASGSESSSVNGTERREDVRLEPQPPRTAGDSQDTPQCPVSPVSESANGSPKNKATSAQPSGMISLVSNYDSSSNSGSESGE